MDMREMVDKVKKGEPLYGKSDLTPYMQGVAVRNSRYSALFAHIMPWANFVNHNQVSSIHVMVLSTYRRSMVLIQRNITNKQNENWKLRKVPVHEGCGKCLHG